jgi:hypothetical protein
MLANLIFLMVPFRVVRSLVSGMLYLIPPMLVQRLCTWRNLFSVFLDYRMRSSATHERTLLTLFIALSRFQHPRTIQKISFSSFVFLFLSESLMSIQLTIICVSKLINKLSPHWTIPFFSSSSRGNKFSLRIWFLHKSTHLITHSKQHRQEG